MAEATDFSLLDRFVPAPLRSDVATLRRVRMFLVSHIFGTPLGHLICVYFYFVDLTPGLAFWSMVALITAFFAYPPLLKWGVRYGVLAFVSVQHLTLLVLLAS